MSQAAMWKAQRTSAPRSNQEHSGRRATSPCGRSRRRNPVLRLMLCAMTATILSGSMEVCEAMRRPGANKRHRSDGPQPHYINIHFVRRVSLKYLSIYMDYIQDESYTPAKFSIRAGTCYHDLQEVSVVDVHEPRGWKHINLGAAGTDGLLRMWLIQVCILLNHQNGKDTHVRNIRLYAPCGTATDVTVAREPRPQREVQTWSSLGDEQPFSSRSMRQFDIR